MTIRGLYDRDGEAFGYLDGDKVYDLDGNLTGLLEGRVVYDLAENRKWLIDGDALLDLRGTVIGYLSDRVAPRDND